MRSCALVALGLALASGGDPHSAALPAGAAEHRIRCAGGDTLQPLASRWGESFQHHHPEVDFSVDTAGKLSADGFEGLLDGRMDCVLMVREPFEAETQAFQQRFGHPPGLLRVASGSFDTAGGTHAIAIYVNATNPLPALSLPQLRQIFAGKPPANEPALLYWGQLGLKGAWAGRPIQVYGMLPQRPSGNPPGIVNFLQHRVLAGNRWRADLRVLTDSSDGSALQQIVRRIADDPAGIGYSGFGFQLPGVRAVPIGERGEGPFIAGTQASVANRTYPLTRSVYIAFDPRVMTSAASSLPDFLRYLLSAEAQQAIAADAEGFLPLPDKDIALSRDDLERFQ